MTKKLNKAICQINFIFLLALGLVYPSRLHAAQYNGDDQKEEKEDKKHQQQANPTTSTQHDLVLEKEDSNDLMPTYDVTKQVHWHCKAIESCKAVSTVIACLQSWQAINNDMDKLEEIVQDTSSPNNYKDILGAYHHILDKHLNGKNNKEAFRFINGSIKQHITCAFESCQGYDRNQRDRANELSEKDEIERYGEELLFIRDTLDTIHAYLVHGSDSGHLYITNDKPEKGDKGAKDDLGDHDKDEADITYTLVDQKMAALKKWQGDKKKNRHQAKTKFNTTLAAIKHNDNPISFDLLANRFKNNQTFTYWLKYMSDNECDTDTLLHNINTTTEDNILYHAFNGDKDILVTVTNFIHKITDQKVEKPKQESEKNKKTASYGYGVRLYYWEKYKHNTNIDNDYNPDYRYCDLYVSPVHQSFKKEILAKGIPLSKWKQKMYAAKLVLAQSAILRQLKAGGLYADYGIKKDDYLSIWHILSIYFYTDFTKLCTDFGGSFRYASSAKNVQDIVSNNAKWHHLSKYLREVVECFGTRIDGKAYDPGEGTMKQIKEIKGDTYYHGVSYLLFTEFSVNWFGPLSTSRQIEVATLFTTSTDNGLLLELKEDSAYLRFFNVCLLSCFGSEDERLFIGGYQPIQIASIRLLKDDLNLEQIMHALFMVNSIIRGKEPGHDNKALPVDGTIFSALHASPTKFPLYARKIWDKFRHKQQSIRIDMYYMYNYYKMFIPQLSSPKHKNLLLFDKIAKIFPSVTEIICKRTDYDGDKGGYFSAILGPKFIEGLKDSLGKMDKNTKLQKIIIQTREHKVKDAHNVYVKLFDPLGWQTGKGNHTIVLTKQPYSVMYKDASDKISAMVQAKKPSYEVTSLDANILEALIANKNIPSAVQQKWEKLNRSCKRIKINMRYMYKYYTLFVPLLCARDLKCKNLLLFGQIAQLFSNATEIICEHTDWDGEKIDQWGNKGSYSAAIVSSDFIASLKKGFQEIPKHTKLTKVIMQTHEKEIKDKCNLYATQFADLGWQIQRESYKGVWIAKNNQITLTKLSGASILGSSKK